MYKVSLYHYRNGFEQDFPTAASRVLYDDTKLDGIRTIFEPVVKNSITEIPSFEFSILPNHPLYDELVKFSTIITVQRNSTVLFYGRVMHDGIDFYGQRKVSCEGALGFLLDTVISPKDTGSVTPKAFLTTIINEHNNIIVSGESYKRFTIGTVTASKVKDGTEYTVDNSNLAKKFKTESYTQTKSVIESELVNEYKGFLCARYEGGTLYLDWLKSIGRSNSQPVKMAVNMLDRTFEENTDDYYTVLFPIGDKKITIASANNGNKYLEDSTAIAKHGRIIKSVVFSDCKTSSALLTKARDEFAKRGTNLPTSWHVKAVDMSLLGENVAEILVGDHLTKLEDRDGSFVPNVTVVEASYNLLDPSQDEYIIENQEAIDQRNNSDRGNGTLSGRTGGISGSFDGDSADFRKNYNTYQLTVNDWYDLTANTITERSQQHNIVTGILNAMFDDGYFDSFTGNNVKEVTITNPDGSTETAWVQAMTGSRVHQDPSGITSYVQDISGIRMRRIETLDPSAMPQGADKAEAFSESKAYAVGDFCYIESNNKRTYYRFTKAHSPGAWNASEVEVLTGGKSYIYEPIYKTDSQGNTYYDLVTGEAVYATINDADENKVHIPLRSIATQTQSEFYQVVGTTDISRVMNLPDGASGAEDFSASKSYAVGDYCYYTVDGERLLYRFTSAHTGAWNPNHVVAIDIQTIQKMTGSTLWQKENEIVNVVGEVEITSIVPPEASQATAFSESVTYNAGDVVWYPPTGKDRGLYKFTKTHRAGAWLGTDVKQITTKTVVIKNGTGLQVIKDGVGVGIFKDGEIDAGLIVESLNNGETQAKIKASRVDISSTSGSGINIDQNGNININVNDLVNNINTNASLNINAARINLTSGAVIKAINGGQSGDSSLLIDVDKLNLNSGAIIKAINGSGDGASELKIDADKLNIIGLFAEGMAVEGVIIAEGGIDLPDAWIDIQDGGGITFGDYNLTESLAATMVVNATKSADGNTLTLTKLNGDVINFSKATTLSSDGWDSGVFTVTATQNSTQVGTYTTEITQGTATWNGYAVTVPIMATDTTSGGYAYSTGRTVYVDASNVVSAAVANAHDEVNVSKGSWNGGVVTFSPSYNGETTSGGSSILTLQMALAPHSTYQRIGVVSVNDLNGGNSIPTGISHNVYLQANEDYCYITSTSAAPSASNIIAQIDNPGGGSSSQGGITDVTQEGWTYTNNRYQNVVTAFANDGSSESETVLLPTISCHVNTGTSSNATIRPYGPGDNIISTGTALTLYLKFKDNDNDFVYLTNANADPVTGTNVVARAANPAYANGQTAAGVSINVNNKTVDRSLSSSTKSVAISAVASISYNASTHKYTAYSTAKAANTEMDSDDTESGTQAYDAGWSAAYGKVTLPSAMAVSSNNLVTVKTPPSTVDGAATTTNLYLVCADDYVYIRSANNTTSGTTYARITNTKQGAEGGIASVALNANSDESSDWNDWTYSSSASISGRYALIKATPNSGSPYYFGVNASGVYTAGYNAAPVGLATPITDAIVRTATTDDYDTASAWGANRASETDGKKHVLYTITTADGVSKKFRVNASSTYTAGYNAAPVGVSDNCVAHVEYTDDASVYGNTWIANNYGGSMDTLTMNGRKYKLCYAVGNDGSRKYFKIHAENTYDAGVASVGFNDNFVVREETTDDSTTYQGWVDSLSDGFATAGAKYIKARAVTSSGVQKSFRINASTTYTSGYDAGVTAGTAAVTVSISNYKNSTNSKDYDDWSGTALGTLSANTYYQFRAAGSNSKYAYAKFKTPASSSGVSASAIDLYVLGTTTTKPTTSTHPGYTSIVQMNTLIGLIDLYKNSSSPRYIPIEAKLTSGGTGNKKLYYISVGGSSD